MGMVSCGSSGGNSPATRGSGRTASLAGARYDPRVSRYTVGKQLNTAKKSHFPAISDEFPPSCYLGWGAPMAVGFSVMEDFAPSPCRSRVSSKSFPVDFTMENGTSAVTQVSEAYLSLRKCPA